MMKKLLLFALLFVGLNAFGQVKGGTYVNQVGQVLKITNVTDCCFDYEVKWGVNDKWGCIFESSGTAQKDSPTEAFDGDSIDWANVRFTIDANTIHITGGLDFIGMDCAEFGESSSDKYCLFKLK